MTNLTISDIKKHNKKAGQHWFSAGAMSFFETQIYPTVYQDKFFITHEVDPNRIKRFSVRIYDVKTGEVSTHGEFGAFNTLSDAEDSARKG